MTVLFVEIMGFGSRLILYDGTNFYWKDDMESPSIPPSGFWIKRGSFFETPQMLITWIGEL